MSEIPNIIRLLNATTKGTGYPVADRRKEIKRLLELSLPQLKKYRFVYLTDLGQIASEFFTLIWRDRFELKLETLIENDSQGSLKWYGYIFENEKGEKIVRQGMSQIEVEPKDSMRANYFISIGD